MFDFDTARMIKAATALQVAAYEWDDDKSQTQAEARQAIIGMREAINVAQQTLAIMSRMTEKRRDGK